MASHRSCIYNIIIEIRDYILQRGNKEILWQVKVPTYSLTIKCKKKKQLFSKIFFSVEYAVNGP